MQRLTHDEMFEAWRMTILYRLPIPLCLRMYLELHFPHLGREPAEHNDPVYNWVLEMQDRYGDCDEN